MMGHVYEGVFALAMVFLFAQGSEGRLLETGALLVAIGALWAYQQRQENRRQKEASDREDKLMAIVREQRDYSQEVLTNLVKEATSSLKMHATSMDHNTAHIAANTQAVNMQTERIKALEERLKSQQPRVD